MSLRRRYQRTECGCKVCVTCCKHMPGNLIPEDLPLLAGSNEYEDILRWAREHLLASEGALVVHPSDPTTAFRVGTLVPKIKPDGSCIFLSPANRCEIHSVAPFGCAYNDTHMTFEEGHERSVAAVTATAAAHDTGDVYSRVWQVLWDAGQRAAPLAERKGRLAAETKRVERKMRRKKRR